RRSRRGRTTGNDRGRRGADSNKDGNPGRSGWLGGFEDFLSRLDAGKVRGPWAMRAGSRGRANYDRSSRSAESDRERESLPRRDEYASGPIPAVDYRGRSGEFPSGPMPAVNYRGQPAEYPSGSMPAVDYGRGSGEYPSGSMPAVDYRGRPGEYPSGPMPAVDYGRASAEYPSGSMPAVDYRGRPGEY